MSQTVNVEREIILEGGPRDGMVIKTSQKHSIEVAFIEDSKAIRCDPDEPKPWTEIRTVRYRSSYEYDEGREVYKPDWATVQRYSSTPVDLVAK